MFFPIFPWIFELAILVVGVGVGLYLASVGELSYKVIALNSESCKCIGVAVSYTNGSACVPKTFEDNCYSVTNPNVKCDTNYCTFTGIDNPNIITYFHVSKS